MPDPLFDPPEALPPELRRRLRLLDTEAGTARLWAAVALLAALTFAAFLATGANGPADPRPATGSLRSPLAGFGDVEFVVARPGDLPTTTSFCALLAETPTTQQQGMMGRTDLAGFDAMVFRFTEDQTSPFFNRRVPIALSIAWFDASGRLVSTADMPPCEDRDDCPLFSAAGPYRTALEVPAGGLSRFGIGPGSVLALGGSCREGAPGR